MPKGSKPPSPCDSEEAPAGPIARGAGLVFSVIAAIGVGLFFSLVTAVVLILATGELLPPPEGILIWMGAAAILSGGLSFRFPVLGHFVANLVVAITGGG
jgi:hypothetical protein